MQPEDGDKPVKMQSQAETGKENEKMANWFKETFLLSLYERAEQRKINLTAKQVAVCVKYMEPHRGHRESLYRQAGNDFTWYSIEWDGRYTTLSIYPNGCGCMEFGTTEEEQERAAEEEDRRKAEERTARIERIKANPERLKRHLKKLQEDFSRYSKELNFYRELQGSEDWEEDDMETLQYYEEKVTETEKKIQELTA